LQLPNELLYADILHTNRFLTMRLTHFYHSALRMKQAHFLYLFIGWIVLAVMAGITGCRQNSPASEQQNQADAAEDTTAEMSINNIPQIKQLTQRISQDSANAQLYFLRGSVYAKANAPNLAAADFYRALAIDSVNSLYYLAAAEVFFTKTDLKTAIRLLEKAQALLPDSMNIKTELGKYYYYVQQYEPAVETLQKVIAAQPNNAAALFWTGMTYRDKNETDKAIDYLKKATKFDPDFYNGYMVLANLLAQKNNPDALTHYNKALAIDSLSIEALYGKALFLQNTGKTKDALDTYRKIVLIEPQYPDAHYNTGYIYYNQNDYETALKNFNIAIRVSPAYAKAYYMRGLCAEKLGKTADAKTDFLSALKFDPKLTLAEEALNRVNK